MFQNLSSCQDGARGCTGCSDVFGHPPSHDVSGSAIVRNGVSQVGVAEVGLVTWAVVGSHGLLICCGVYVHGTEWYMRTYVLVVLVVRATAMACAFMCIPSSLSVGKVSV